MREKGAGVVVAGCSLTVEIDAAGISGAGVNRPHSAQLENPSALQTVRQSSMGTSPALPDGMLLVPNVDQTIAEKFP